MAERYPQLVENFGESYTFGSRLESGHRGGTHHRTKLQDCDLPGQTGVVTSQFCSAEISDRSIIRSPQWRGDVSVPLTRRSTSAPQPEHQYTVR